MQTPTFLGLFPYGFVSFPSFYHHPRCCQVAADRIAKRAVELYDAALRFNASDFPQNLNFLDEEVYKDADIPERLPSFEFSPYFKQVGLVVFLCKRDWILRPKIQF